MSDKPILQVRDLVTAFDTDGGRLTAVDGVSFEVNKGKVLGIVGESGCGKSVTAMSLVRLLPRPAGKILGGEVIFNDRDLLSLPYRELYHVRGRHIGIVFQEPMAALNPLHRIGRQVAESVRLHRKVNKEQAWARAVEMLHRVGIPAPEQRAMEYPHQLSGGMRQRVVIAIALACSPELLIADEPTTALDVTVQAQILALLHDLKKEMGLGVILITHDLGVVAENCDTVLVMYGGRVVESAPVGEIFKNPQHAYTKGLLRSMPTMASERKSRLPTIPGAVAPLELMVPGCRYCQRMERTGQTLETRYALVEAGAGHWVESCPECAPEVESKPLAGEGSKANTTSASAVS